MYTEANICIVAFTEFLKFKTNLNFAMKNILNDSNRTICRNFLNFVLECKDKKRHSSNSGSFLFDSKTQIRCANNYIDTQSKDCKIKNASSVSNKSYLRSNGW